MSEAAAIERWEGRSAAEWQSRWRVPELHLFRQIDSTNSFLRERGAAGAPAGTVAIADEQTAGRGRRGRTWHAPAGEALLLSVLFRPSGGRPAATLPLRIGLAVADAVEAVTGLRLGIKWPNDLVMPGHGKLAGILCESSAAAARVEFIAAGIGINVGQEASAWPSEIQASSLRLLLGRTVHRGDLADALVPRLLRLQPPHDPLGPDVLDRLAERDVLRGRNVTVDGESRGAAAGFTPGGALRVRTDDGGEALVRSGTVRPLHTLVPEPGP